MSRVIGLDIGGTTIKAVALSTNGSPPGPWGRVVTARVLVAGGTGRLGRLVVAALADRDLDVRVMSRDTERALPLVGDHVEIVHGDVLDERSTRSAMVGVDVAVSAVQGFAGPGRVSPRSVDRDGNIALINAARDARAEAVLMSVHSLLDEVFSCPSRHYAVAA